MNVLSGVPVSVEFDRTVARVVGETVTGRVTISFAGGRADRLRSVTVRLVGKVDLGIDAMIGLVRNQNGGADVHASYDILEREQVVWSKATSDTIAPPNSGSMTIPFALELSSSTAGSDLPPTFDPTTSTVKASVRYWLEVCVASNGLLRRGEHRTRMVFPVTLPSTADDVAAKAQLEPGWDGRWVTRTAARQIRRHAHGDVGAVRVELRLPELSSLPVGVDIPFSLRAECTINRPPNGRRGSGSSSSASSSSSQGDKGIVRLQLRRTMQVPRPSTEPFLLVETVAAMTDDAALLQAVVVEPTGAQSQDGCVRKAFSLQSSFRLPDALPPTFSNEKLSNDYSLRLNVPFPELDYTLGASFPVTVVSGRPPAPPPKMAPTRAPSLQTLSTLPEYQSERGRSPSFLPPLTFTPSSPHYGGGGLRLAQVVAG